MNTKTNNNRTKKMNTVLERNEAPISPVTSISKTDDVVVGGINPFLLCQEVASATFTADKQDQNMIRIPCRARGVCESHTPNTAYFEIPEDCQHGKMLTCSHPKCANSGRQFRYCKICDQATAKRNFTKRHAHEEIGRPAPAKRNNSLGSTGSKKRKTPDDSDESSIYKTPSDDCSTVATDLPITPNVPKTVCAMTNDSQVFSVLTQQEVGWLELCHNRPAVDDPIATNQWIQAILLATDAKIMGGDILTDDEDEVYTEKSGHFTSSLDNFDLLMESLDGMVMSERNMMSDP